MKTIDAVVSTGFLFGGLITAAVALPRGAELVMYSGGIAALTGAYRWARGMIKEIDAETEEEIKKREQEHREIENELNTLAYRKSEGKLDATSYY